ncbi:hypothetical protein L6452_18581 [Arctium lappa]|uniref:Uncharacterized protein n=1 Tax=Arctium lappa TaxID=4217 RepID=A0ACB9C6Q6_ARCLA|nr:hypothetical protein L6452_18581 [Arctium lappa]
MGVEVSEDLENSSTLADNALKLVDDGLEVEASIDEESLWEKSSENDDNLAELARFDLFRPDQLLSDALKWHWYPIACNSFIMSTLLL